MQGNNGIELDINEPDGGSAERSVTEALPEAEKPAENKPVKKTGKASLDTHEARVEKLLKKQLRWTRVCAVVLILMLAFAAAVAVIVTPDIVLIRQTVNKIDAIADDLSVVAEQLESADIEGIAENLKTVSVSLSEIDWKTLVTDIDGVVEAAEKGIGEATRSIEELDIETLNSAIADLNEVVKPLAKLVSAFG